MKKNPNWKPKWEDGDYPFQIAQKEALLPFKIITVALVICCLMIIFWVFWGGDAKGVEALRYTTQLWDETQFITRIGDTDPVFSDSTNVQAALIKDAFGWIQSEMKGYTYFKRYLLKLDTDSLAYVLSNGTYEYPVRIKSVMHYATDSAEALSSVDVSDLSKRFDNNNVRPFFYAYDQFKEIEFNSYPSIKCTVWVWSYRQANTDSACAWLKYPPITAPLKHLLIQRVVSLARLKERNLVAHQNCWQITEAMLKDAMQIYQMVERTKDIIVPPLRYEE